MPRIKPMAAGWSAQPLPLRYAATPLFFLLGSCSASNSFPDILIAVFRIYQGSELGHSRRGGLQGLHGRVVDGVFPDRKAGFESWLSVVRRKHRWRHCGADGQQEEQEFELHFFNLNRFKKIFFSKKKNHERNFLPTSFASTFLRIGAYSTEKHELFLLIFLWREDASQI